MVDSTANSFVYYSPNKLVAYANLIHAPHDAALNHAFTAPERIGLPAIQIGPSEGRLLEILVQLIGAQRIVEVGTLCGYSAIRMARVLPPDGHLWTIELEEKNANVARQNIALANLTEQIDVVVGPASEQLPLLVAYGPFDLVFIDADKEGYPNYGRWAAANLRKGGLLIADNAFLFGCLLDDDPTAVAMRRFHEETPNDFDSVCVSTPDGMVVGIRR
jgi:caffeoyl-CoA O-methyltransferase